MQERLYIELVGCLSEKGFSLDELVIKVKQVVSKEGAAGVVELLMMLLMMYDEIVSRRLSDGESFAWFTPCCEWPQYEFHGKRKRGFRTAIKGIQIYWTRLRCCRCGSTPIPLRDLLGIEPYQRKTAELEHVVMETVSETAYRRTTKHLETIGHIPVPKSTAHRWVMESDCDEISVDKKTVQTLIPDGTGYKRRPDPDKGINNRGELKVVMGVLDNGVMVPFGAWSDISWEEIGEQIRNGTTATPVAENLMTDGEVHLSEAFADLANNQGRCHWHMINDLSHPMWRNGAALAERRTAQKQLAGILGIEVPAEDYRKVPEEEKHEIEESVREAEGKVEQLAGELSARGYSDAAIYLRNAKDKLFTHIRFWLETGLLPTRTTSIVERLMRELGRRLKKIAFGWSPRGVAKIARIILKRITSANEWELCWKRRLRLDGNVVIVLCCVKVAQ